MIYITAKSQSGDYYSFKACGYVTQYDFDVFVKQEYPDEFVDGINLIDIISQTHDSNLPFISVADKIVPNDLDYLISNCQKYENNFGKEAGEPNT